MRPIERQALDRLTHRLRDADSIAAAVREVGELDGTIYDPMADQYAMRIPGELVRRLLALADPA